jgi:hypothetical protein
MSDIDDDTMKLANAVACLRDAEWLKKNGPALVAGSMKNNLLLQLHKVGALNPLMKAAQELDGEG